MRRSWNRAACGRRIGMCGYTSVPADGRTCFTFWLLRVVVVFVVFLTCLLSCCVFNVQERWVTHVTGDWCGQAGHLSLSHWVSYTSWHLTASDGTSWPPPSRWRRLPATTCNGWRALSPVRRPRWSSRRCRPMDLCWISSGSDSPSAPHHLSFLQAAVYLEFYNAGPSPPTPYKTQNVAVFSSVSTENDYWIWNSSLFLCFRNVQRWLRPVAQAYYDLRASKILFTPRAQFTDGRCRLHNHVQYNSRHRIRLLQRPSICAAHLRRYSTNFSLFRITWRRSSANVADAVLSNHEIR